MTHSVDYYWLSRMWADRGERMPEADFVVAPKDAQETSKVLKIANYYKIPVTTWGGGGGTQGGAIPVCGGIILDTKRMNQIYEVNTEGMYIECGTGAIYKHLEEMTVTGHNLFRTGNYGIVLVTEGNGILNGRVTKSGDRFFVPFQDKELICEGDFTFLLCTAGTRKSK